MKAVSIFRVEKSTCRGENLVGAEVGDLGAGLSETTLVMRTFIS
jgi:hypothetical protein